jgi:hypothetical protein
MATISTLAVNLIARTSVFDRRIKNSRRNMRTFKEQAVSARSSLAGFAKGLLISGGAVFAIKALTKAASDAEEVMNIFNTVFAENAAATSRWATKFADRVGRSRTAVKEWAATLQDTFVPLGFARDRATELSTSLVELAVDVGSFKNAADKDVIDAFTSAIVGNHRAVRAYGVVLTNATIEAESYASGINKAFSKLTELEKVQLRYNLLLKGTKDAQGDATRTSHTYANTTKRLSGNIQDLKEAIGLGLLPAMNELVTATNKFTGAAVKFRAVGKAIAVITDLVKGLGGVIRTTVGVVQGLLTGALKVMSFNIKSLAVAVGTLNNIIASTKLGETLGLKELDLTGLFSALDEISDTFKDAAEENIKKGAEAVKSAFLGESVKAYERLLEDAQAKTEAALAAASKKVITPPVADAVLGDEAEKQADKLNEKFRTAQFQTVRSQFIDVGALTPTTREQKLTEQNNLTKETNEILRSIEKKSTGAFQI